MAKYEIQINTPDTVRLFIEGMQGQGNLVLSTSDPARATFEFEAEDLWDAANVVRDTFEEIAANIGVHSIDYGKPVEVEEWRSLSKAVIPHDVECPNGVGQVVTRSGADGSGSYWPAKAVALILEAHGIKVDRTHIEAVERQKRAGISA